MVRIVWEYTLYMYSLVGEILWPVTTVRLQQSKLLERLVARQLLDYLNAAGLLPEQQSAYRANHSTETAVVRILSDILLALDTGDLCMLTLLDLSAAFDTVDHDTLLRLNIELVSR